ncbi:hypothetical protein FGIG_10648 [Fasciola gigantica]|uniref:Uncharacterized protein n=1 Tax=Fasciola gigantica TaxID=46835 RepID=A0A504YYS3_FASGI|nr:hypothetical protein FGIG_10648 [Fasciola gigantica]
MCDQMLPCEWPQYECPYAHNHQTERNKMEEQLEELETMIKNNTENQDTLKQMLAILQQKVVAPDEAVSLNLSASENKTQPRATHHMEVVVHFSVCRDSTQNGARSSGYEFKCSTAVLSHFNSTQFIWEQLINF